MGLPLSEPAPSDHQMSTRQRVGDAHSYTCRRGSNPQRHTMLHRFRRDMDSSGTARRCARQPRRPISIRTGRRHAGAHPGGHPPARNTVPLAPDNHSSLLRTHSPAGTRDVSPVEISVCCLMLPAHRQGHRRQYTPVPNAPRSGFRKPDSHRLCRTTMQQCNVRRLHTAAQRLIHSRTNRQCQFADSSTHSNQGPPNQGRRLSGIPLTSGLRTTKHRY